MSPNDVTCVDGLVSPLEIVTILRLLLLFSGEVL